MTILNQIIEVAFNKRLSRDITYSPVAALLTIIVSAGVSIVLLSQNPIIKTPILYSCIQILGQVGGLYFILLLNKKQNRFVQTSTALFGVGALISSLNLLSVILPALAILNIFILIWFIYVHISIIKDALDCSAFASFMFNLAIIFFSSMLLFLVLPETILEFLQYAKTELNKTN